MEERYPQIFMRFYIPILEVLKELGGSAKSSEVTDLVIEKLSISEQEQKETLKNGTSKVRNQIAWARNYLVESGFLESSQRGVWTLTENGYNAQLTKSDVIRYVIEVQAKHSKAAKKKTPKEIQTDIDENSEAENENYRTDLLELLKGLSPEGFERICRRLFLESGFQKVIVTGKSGDGGIDGHGILQVNPFVSFNVLFQCKRYKDVVSPSHIRDFRGAMSGRTDKGIFITTGTFTNDAKKEATRDGVPPIELVDGENLVEMFKHLELGLKPKTVYEVDFKFFEDYL